MQLKNKNSCLSLISFAFIIKTNLLNNQLNLMSMPSLTSTTFQVEVIEVSSKTHSESNYSSIINHTIATKVISHNKTNHPLVHYGTHSFLQGLYQAYADHRPFCTACQCQLRSAALFIHSTSRQKRIGCSK